MQPEAPKFIRDQIRIDDIEGTKSKVEPKRAVRDPISVKDIPGAGNRVPYSRKKDYDSRTYADVYKKDWASSRRTNPLVPEYNVRD